MREQLGAKHANYTVKHHEDGPLKGQIEQEKLEIGRGDSYIEVVHYHHWSEEHLSPEVDTYDVLAEYRQVARAQMISEANASGTRVHAVIYRQHDDGKKVPVNEQRTSSNLTSVLDTVDAVVEDLTATKPSGEKPEEQGGT
jgi:hypothetical protein